MKNMKRLISTLTVVCMIFSLFSTVSFAATDNLNLNEVAIEPNIESEVATGRKFVISGTYSGYGEGETILISVSKGGIENPETLETLLVNNVKTTAGGAFTQTIIIPFDEEYYGDYVVVVNSANGSVPKGVTFTMTAASTVATLEWVSFMNDTVPIKAIADEEAKTVVFDDVPNKVNLDGMAITFKADAARKVEIYNIDEENSDSLELIDTCDYDDAKKVFVSHPVTFGSGQEKIIRVYPENGDPTDYTMIINKRLPSTEADLSNIYLWLENSEGSLRGFKAGDPVETVEEGETFHDVMVKVPAGFDMAHATITYDTTAVGVYPDTNLIDRKKIIRRTSEEDESATIFDFSKDSEGNREPWLLVLKAESDEAPLYQWRVFVKTSTVSLNEVTIGEEGDGEEIKINRTTKKITRVVNSQVDRSNMVLTFDAYDANVTVDGRPFESGTYYDFTQPVTLALEADDGTSEEYVITVSVDPKTIAELTSFKVAGKTATIDHRANTIKVTIPANAATQVAYTASGKGTLQVGTSAGGSFYAFEDKASSNNVLDFDTYKYVRVLAEDGKIYSDPYKVIITEEEVEEKDTTTQKPSTDDDGDSFIVVDRPVVEPNPQATVNFVDLGTAEWARESINNLAKRGVVSGRSETIFDPDGLVTREEYAKMLVLAFGLTADNAVCDKFWDVSPTDWYYEYVAIAEARGIVNGMGNGSFGVGTTITRQDMAVMTYRAAMATGKAFDYVNEPITFTDGGNIATYAIEAVTVMQRAGIINGMGGNTFLPVGTATRAQAAKIMDMATK